MGSVNRITVTERIKDRISTLESFISQKIGYYTVYVSHLGFLSPASI